MRALCASLPYVPGDYRVACVVSVPVITEIGIIDHKGILSNVSGDDGLPMVIHNAKLFGKVIEASMTTFRLKARGPVSSDGYPGELAPLEVLRRARSELETPWLVWRNCEHFVHWAHGLEMRSPQLRQRAGKVAIRTAGLGAACLARLL